jgi:imidazolonepropionase-like amidohydrolase
MPRILLTNANLVLSGFAELQRSFNVLVKDNYINSVSSGPIDCPDATLIDVGGGTLMPGLIDAHAHITGLSLSPKNVSYPSSNIAMAAANYLRHSLMDGFTTIREAGGADYSIAQLLAQGEIVGPRLFYSGRALTQTGGGADFRTPFEQTDPCGHVGPFSVMSVIADGVDEVRKAAREELRRGASQIKLFASGGVVFPSEAHATLYEYSEAELSAAVEEAAARSTYVMACLHGPRDSAVPEGRRAFYRARQFCPRRDGGNDGRSRGVFRSHLHLSRTTDRNRDRDPASPLDRRKPGTNDCQRSAGLSMGAET